MTTDEVKDFIVKYKQGIEDWLNLNRWDISYSIEPGDPENETDATCECNNVYMHATITINCSKMEDEDLLWETVIHENLHCVLSNYNTYCKTADPDEILDPVFRFINERAIIHLTDVLTPLIKAQLCN